MPDPFNLDRFVQAQDRVLAQARAELLAGQSAPTGCGSCFRNWRGLGRSDTARYYALASLEEARAYLAHPLLGPRLIECTNLVNAVEGRSANGIYRTSPDDLKFHSSMTLFALAQPEEQAFSNALGKYFGGAPDRLTSEQLSISPGSPGR